MAIIKEGKWWVERDGKGKVVQRARHRIEEKKKPAKKQAKKEEEEH